MFWLAVFFWFCCGGGSGDGVIDGGEEVDKN